LDLRSWYRRESGGTIVFRAWNLDRTGLVTHGFTCRQGGASAEPFDTLNLGLHVGDEKPSVIENRRRTAHALHLAPESITTAEQIHGNQVALVTEQDAGRGRNDYAEAIPGADALITNVPGPVLMLFFADCVPVFILDPKTRAIALAHAGWKGTALRIGAETIRAMSEHFGTDPSDCLVAIGPAIGRCCYDVSADVAIKVREAVDDDRVIARANQDQWRLDLKLANWATLRAAGVHENNIAISHHCTACDPEHFFSYRRDGETGRMAAVMSLLPKD
jgi:YfiH family protein